MEGFLILSLVLGGTSFIGLGVMQYPLQIKFKVIAFAPQIFIHDAAGNSVAYIRQKFFKFREHVQVYTTKNRQNLVADIKTNKILDWSARYCFTDSNGADLGSVGRKGMRSIWRASYTTFSPTGEEAFLIEEENPLAKVFDSLLGEVPVIGLLSTVLFQPKYIAKRIDTGEPVMRLTKQAAFFEGRFQLDHLGVSTTEQEELSLLLSFQMLSLLERARG